MKKYEKVDHVASVSKVICDGIELLLSIVVYCWLKYSLNKFAFTKKSVTSWLPTNNGGISGILSLANVFSIYQQVFGAALGSLSLFKRRSWYFSCCCFFLSGFSFTNIHYSRDSRGRVGYLFNSSLPLPPALQTLRH